MTKAKINTFQQGDVIGRKVTALPDGNRKILFKHKLRLAEGEHTGHFHGVSSDNGTLMEIDGRMFMSLESPATITHQEHGHIEVDKGIWEIGRVQEYDYFSKMVRNVQD